MRSRTKALVGAVIAIVAAVVLVISVKNEPEARTYTIETSYMFDPTNLSYLAGYADAIVFGTVDEVVETLPGQSRTLYSFQVQQSLKGSVNGRIVVDQLGYVDGGDRHVPGDQPLLQPGHTYLLVITSAGSNQYTVIAGPESVVDLNGVDRAALIRRWTEAIATQQCPPGLPPQLDP